MNTTLRKSAIRFLFIMLLPLLAAQFYFARRYDEPYPAIIFPGFTSVPTHQTYPYTYQRLVIMAYSENDSVEVTMDDLFAPMPYKAKVFYVPMGNKIKSLPTFFPGASPRPSEQELMRYFQTNVRSTTNLAIDRISFRWYQYRATSPFQTRKTDLIDEKTVYLSSV